MFLQGVSAAAVPLAGCAAMSGNKVDDEGKIPRRSLGKTGIQVSMLGFGSHLSKECQANPKLRDRMIKAAYDGGINFFDVYDHSGFKQFEPMGKSIEGFRKNVVVSVCIVQPVEKMQEEIDGALVKFRTDYIDCYRMYGNVSERIPIFEKNKKAGKIRSIGVVFHNAEEMKKSLDPFGDVLDYVMMPFNFHHNNGYFVDPKNYGDNDYTALIPRCEKMGLGIMGIKPMGSDHMIELAKKEGMLNKSGIGIAQAMLRYTFQTPEIDVAMPAMNTMNELKTNLQAAYRPALSTQEREALGTLSGIASRTKSAYLPGHYRWLENWASGRIV
jgi:predicted aldo/keto reductase-like oxidoreductase